MQKIDFEETIAAIATPVGEGGISVIRMSGAQSFEILDKVFKPVEASKKMEDQKPHTLHLGTVLDAKRNVIDQVLVALFKNPRSYTGEDVVEFSSHGGMVVTRTILERLLEAGARRAEPGEFTRRAFLNGKMDLTRAEAVLDLIKAKSDLSREVAVRHLQGKLAEKLGALKDRYMKLYAHMEAYVDFPEADIEVYENKKFSEEIDYLLEQLAQLAASFTRGSLLREGASIVIAGRPNAGKSSIFNGLLERDRAIVSEFQGTTRDCLEESIEIGGFYARLVDTAGLWSGSTDPVEKMGMARTRRAIQEADLILFILDGSEVLSETDQQILSEIPTGTPVLAVINKTDLGEKLETEVFKNDTRLRARLRASAEKGTGFSELEKEIAKVMDQIAGSGAAGEQITRQRHRDAIVKSHELLEQAKKAFIARESLDCVTYDLKESLDALRELVGEIYSEDLLDVIFAEFCIGK